MLLVAPVREDRRLSSSMDGFEQSNYDMLAVVNRARSDVPAVTHVDFKCPGPDRGPGRQSPVPRHSQGV